MVAFQPLVRAASLPAGPKPPNPPTGFGLEFHMLLPQGDERSLSALLSDMPFV